MQGTSYKETLHELGNSWVTVDSKQVMVTAPGLCILSISHLKPHPCPQLKKKIVLFLIAKQASFSCAHLRTLQVFPYFTMVQWVSCPGDRWCTTTTGLCFFLFSHCYPYGPSAVGISSTPWKALETETVSSPQKPGVGSRPSTKVCSSHSHSHACDGCSLQLKPLTEWPQLPTGPFLSQNR